MKHICPDCYREEDTEEAHCKLHIKAGQVKEILTAYWKSLRDGMGREGATLKHALAFVEAYKEAGLISNEEADAFSLRMQYRCPGHDDEGGRVWCAYCGNIKPENPA